MARTKIKNIIAQSIRNLQRAGIFEVSVMPEVCVERPEDLLHGDYATNVALQLAKIVKKRPMELAEKLELKMKNYESRMFSKIEAVEPGFINFFLSKEYLQKQVAEILKKADTFGELNIGKGKKVNVEFISANPTGPLHIGNGRNAFAGDVIASVLEKAGYKVVREYFVNDAPSNTQIKALGETALGRGNIYLTRQLKRQIKEVMPRLRRTKDAGKAGYLLAQEIQKDIKRFIEKKLKIRFDTWISEEKDLYQKSKIKKTFEWLKEKNLVYQKDAAWWIKTSQFGDEKDWVVIRESGEPTYLLSDIAYHRDKFERGFQKVIDIWGADHQAHVSKMKAAAKMLGYKGEFDILILQLVTLGGRQRLSKRRGQIITLEDLVDEIGLDAARFFYLQKSLGTHMEFDLALAKERSEKNPVYYVQYAHARICSILKKLKTQNSKLKTTTQKLKLLNHASELTLIKQLIRLPEVIEDTAKDYQIQRLPQYAIDLATAFHHFYRDCKVLSEDKSLTRSRLALVFATKTVLKNILDLMGISAPEKM